MLGRLLATLVGDPRTSSLEHRLFNTISLLNGLANLGGAVGLVASAKTPFARSLHVGTGLLFLVFYYASRVRGSYRPLYWPFVALMLGFLSANVLGNAGTLGGAHYYLIPALVIATILGTSTRRVAAAAAVFLGVTFTLLAIEATRPSWVTPYSTPSDRILDVGGNLLFVELFTAALVVILARNLDLERRKSDRLLLNILPEPVADELKRDDRVQPRAYDSATVLFTDCVGFTKVAEGLTAEALVAALDEVFTRFDRIAHAHGLEKIKTIGDAYMAVGGVPVPRPEHAVDAVLTAIEFCREVDALRAERAAAGDPAFAIRVGLHTGPLVAGVIGRSKFAYDIWGDTVNTASRMESSGVAGRVNVSQATYAATRDFFAFEPRGRVEAKGKGAVEMYFVTGLRAELSEDGAGRVPNARFRELRDALATQAASLEPAPHA